MLTFCYILLCLMVSVSAIFVIASAVNIMEISGCTSVWQMIKDWLKFTGGSEHGNDKRRL